MAGGEEKERSGSVIPGPPLLAVEGSTIFSRWEMRVLQTLFSSSYSISLLSSVSHNLDIIVCGKTQQVCAIHSYMYTVEPPNNGHTGDEHFVVL